jgi:hypothetical protein
MDLKHTHTRYRTNERASERANLILELLREEKGRKKVNMFLAISMNRILNKRGKNTLSGMEKISFEENRV